MRKILCLIIMALGVSANAQYNTDRIMSIGRNALYFEDYVLSIQYFNRVISVKPYLAEPYYYRGVAKFYLDFTVEESCGKCAPCRIGNKRLYELLDKITKGCATMEDLQNLENLAKVIKDTALCGLGQTSPNPVLSTLSNFRDEYLAHVIDHRCPAHQCTSLVRYSINPDKCKGCTACARNCPVQAITGTVKNPHTINPEVCIRCGSCVSRCKFGAITVE